MHACKRIGLESQRCPQRLGYVKPPTCDTTLGNPTGRNFQALSGVAKGLISGSHHVSSPGPKRSHL